MRRICNLAVYLGVWALVSGCENPAANVPKAEVAPAQAEVTPTAAPTPAVAPTAAKADPAPGTPVPSTASASTLAFSGEGSKIDFIGSKVTGKHEGGFKSFSGTIELAADKPEIKRLNVEIDMSSTWSDNDRLTGHLKSPDFFDVAKFPKATFVSTEISPGGDGGATHTVQGNFTLHGVTKSIKFPATLAVSNGSATVASEFVINRKDFAIVYPGHANDLIRDEVVIKIAAKAAPAAR